MNRWLPLYLVAGAGAIVIGCTGQTPSTPSSPSPSASAPTSMVSFKTNVEPILKQRCAACHTVGGGGAGSVEMFSAAGAAQHAKIKPAIGQMIDAIRKGRMPRNAPGSVPEAEIKTLEAWQAAGAPNN